ncbi:MAG: serine hydrolase domain-containing protein [Ferruginibacter sp.]
MILAFYKLSNTTTSFHTPFSFLFKEKALTSFWQRLHYALLLILVTTGIFACGAAGKKDKAAGMAEDTSLIVLPKPIPLPAAESKRLNNACRLWYDSTLLLKGFNGGILVAKNGNVVFEQYSGTAHIPGNDAITAATPMHIASVSKTFTAMAVLKLWQDGLLNIDDELNKYIPAFNYSGVTIRSLLNHRSGLPNYTHFLEKMGWDKNKTIGNEALLQFMISNKAVMENVATPNQRFSYCNTNYALLALLVEKVSGKKYADYLRYSFFIPLQMNHTYVYAKEDSLIATPSYDWKGRPMTINFLDAVYGDKNIYTTPRDLLTWDRALSSGKLFKPETLTQAYTPYSNEKPGIRNYGLGWRMNIYPDGKKVIYHNGWWHGSNAAFIRLLKEDATIIVIGNKFTRAVYGAKVLCNLFGDYFNGEEDEENENAKAADSLLLVKKDSATAKPALSKKDQRLQQLFKDKNKVNTH